MDQMTAKGHVDAFLVSPDGIVRHIISGRNTLSYLCADAVARMFAGDSTARPTKIGFVVGASGLNTFNFTTGERNKTQTDIVGTGLSVQDVPIDPNPGRTESGAAVSFNSASYTGITVDKSGYNGDATTIVSVVVTEDTSVSVTHAKITWSSTDSDICSTASVELTADEFVNLGKGLKIKASAIVTPGTYTIYVKAYDGNVVTVKAMTTDNTDSTYVYGFLLKDADDNVLAVKKLDSATNKPANYAMAVSWAVTFN